MRLTGLTIVLLIILAMPSACALVVDYYANTTGGNWTNNPSAAAGAPNSVLAWENIDNGTHLYAFNYSGIPASGQLNSAWLTVRANFTGVGAGNDVLTLKYSVNNGTSWLNLDGNPYNGTNNASESLNLRIEMYQITGTLAWDTLRFIYLGVQGKKVGLPDLRIAAVDALWLRLNITDMLGPLINLMSPPHQNWSSARNVTFFYNVSDELSGVSNCSLVLNGALNSTNSTISEDTSLNFTVIGIPDGMYNWSVNCTDSSEIHNMNSSEVRVLEVDTGGPLVNLMGPANGEWNVSSSVVFSYNVSDPGSGVSNCSLMINGTVNGTPSYNPAQFAALNFTRALTNGNFRWSVNCTDGHGFVNSSASRNLTVDVYAPNVSVVSIQPSITLGVGSSTRVYCNATVGHHDGMDKIAGVNATLYDSTSSAESGDDNNSHYSNSSCSQLGANQLEGNYSCGFSLMYYANNDSWVCKVSATDNNGLLGSRTANTTVNELFGISLYPNEINYTPLNAGQNSSQDVNITVTNMGNSELDITLYGYAILQGDGLSMNCTTGNISVDRERYSLNEGLAYASMTSLGSEPAQVDSFNLGKQVLSSAPSTKSVYWKMGLPPTVGGNCTGYVVFGAVIS